MIKYVIIYLFENNIEFDATNDIAEFSSYLNKNESVSNKYCYEYKYFKRNFYKIIKSLKKKIEFGNKNKLVIKSIFILDLILNNLSSFSAEALEILVDESLTAEDYEKIINYKNLKKFKCYYIPPIYRKKLESGNVDYETTYIQSISDGFLLNNDCIDYDVLYYKKNIVLKDDSDQTLNDLNEFLKLNHNLRGVHLFKFSNEFLLKVIETLKKWNEYKVTICLYQTYDFDGYLKNNIKELRKINSDYYEELNGELKIIYSKKYVIQNLFKQLSFNNLKIMLFIIGYVAFVSMFFNEFSSYIAVSNMNELNNLITTPAPEEVEEPVQDDNASKYNFEQIFSKLLEVNNETVGWLTVNNTNINYPVVKHSDNDYYLHRDFYKAKISSGWVFMDYRNKIDELSSNTIIYGHRVKNGTIFGSLNLILNQNWYTKPENLIITFNTINESMNWQVFSIYSTEYTVDYLKTNFSNETEFNEFINLISNRSVYNFGVSLDYQDKILTLSTCSGNNNSRLVLHAKLIK
jgi:sortase B